jgi:Type IV secretion system pilin
MFSILSSIPKKLFAILFIIIFGACVSFATILSASAATSPQQNGISFLQPTNLKCIFFLESKKGDCSEEQALTTVIQKFLIDLAPFVTTVLIIFGGYEYFVDEQAKKTSAKSTIFAAISGYIIIILAPVITKVIRDTFNGDVNKPIDPTALISLLEQFTNLLIDLSSIAAVVVIVLGGYAYFLQFFINAGKQEGKLNGRELLIAGIIGLIVTTIAKPLVSFIKSIFGPTSSGTLELKTESIITFVRNVLANFLIPFASVVTLICIVASAYLWLTAGSDEERVKNAKKTLTAALIGLVIVLLSTTIVQLIIYFVNTGSGFIPGSSNASEIFKNVNTNGINPNLPKEQIKP